MKKLKRLARPIFQIAMLSLVFAALFSSLRTIGVVDERSPVSNNLNVRTVPVNYIRLEEREHHIYLNPGESATFSAPNQSEGFKFGTEDS